MADLSDRTESIPGFLLLAHAPDLLQAAFWRANHELFYTVALLHHACVRERSLEQLSITRDEARVSAAETAEQNAELSNYSNSKTCGAGAERDCGRS